MPALHHLHNRSEPRVLYRAPVWIRPADQDSSLVGETRNLSRRGMFVSVVPPPALGQEVLCELPGRPAMRGRVAWVLPSGDESERGGVGIEFVDLTTDGADFLENLTGMRLDEAQPVQVWFDGLPSPTRSIARVTHAGIDLSTTLAFLRIGSEVSIGTAESSEAQRLRGRIARVELRTDEGVPRLAISVAALPEPAPLALEPQDERWFPDVVVDEPAAPVVEAAPVLDTPIEVTPALDTPIEAAPAMSLDVDHTERNEAVAPAPRSARKLGLGLMTLGGVVLAGLIVVRVGFPVGDRPAPLPEVAPPAAAPAEPSAAAPSPDPSVEDEPVKTEPAAPVEATPVTTPVEVAKPAKAEVAKPAAKGGPWKPELVTTDGTVSLTVPIAGSTKGMSRYALDEPAGIAVDLPSGKTAVPLKPYLLHDPVFQSLWVRARPAGGLQIRLHVQKGTHVTVDPVDGALRFRRVD